LSTTGLGEVFYKKSGYLLLNDGLNIAKWFNNQRPQMGHGGQCPNKKEVTKSYIDITIY